LNPALHAEQLLPSGILPSPLQGVPGAFFPGQQSPARTAWCASRISSWQLRAKLSPAMPYPGSVNAIARTASSRNFRIPNAILRVWERFGQSEVSVLATGVSILGAVVPEFESPSHLRPALQYCRRRLQTWKRPGPRVALAARTRSCVAAAAFARQMHSTSGTVAAHDLRLNRYEAPRC